MNIYSLGVSAEQVEVPLETGTVITKNGMRYRLLAVDGKKTAAFLVTEVSENALKKNGKIKKVVIGKNAFSGIHKKAVVRVPSSQRKNYQKWFGSFQMK